MKVYMAVTNDKYELPLVQRDTPAELASIFGLKKETVLSEISRNASRKNNYYKFVRVIIDDYIYDYADKYDEEINVQLED